MTLVRSPLLDTAETLSVETDGTVHQVLEQHRESDAEGAVAWSLLPHHQDRLVGEAELIGSMPNVYGQSDVVISSDLELEYPSVPILWDAVAPPGFEASVIGLHDVPEIGTGSYFGAKHTATAATVHDVLRAAGADVAAAPYLAAAEASLDALMSSATVSRLTWDPGWGSVVVSPPEFGSGNELNDHQLQNGYWVGAAASVVMADPSRRESIEEGIDLLIADYAGSAVVPELPSTVPSQGTWSPFHGHCWASGIGGFAAGNNLESVSASSDAWWAAAKWFLVTDRASLAEPFIARLTIETWLTAGEWLPTADNRSDEEATRPWSGVVWAGKSDPGTCFDPSDEAALGIRLLPIGPQSFSRYHDRTAVRAAVDRWAWCDTQGDGCVERWSNLLDTDAAVAGRSELPAGDLPEESTTELVRRWWRSHWDGATVADGWSCTPGTAVRQTKEGSLIALVTNPSSASLTVACHADGDRLLEIVAEPRTSAVIALTEQVPVG